jgi:hypothetical protein
MPNVDNVCIHPALVEVDDELVMSQSRREISRDDGLSKRVVHRYRGNHVYAPPVQEIGDLQNEFLVKPGLTVCRAQGQSHRLRRHFLPTHLP